MFCFDSVPFAYSNVPVYCNSDVIEDIVLSDVNDMLTGIASHGRFISRIMIAVVQKVITSSCIYNFGVSIHHVYVLFILGS